MSECSQKKIVRLLGVGYDTEDGHVRITTGDKFDVLLGSDESHEYITKLILDIETELKRRGIELEELDPNDFAKMVESIK